MQQIKKFLEHHSEAPLLSSALAPCKAKENSFEVRVECVRVNPSAQSLYQRKSIPHGRANHLECTVLLEVRQKGQRELPIPYQLKYTTRTAILFLLFIIYLVKKLLE